MAAVGRATPRMRRTVPLWVLAVSMALGLHTSDASAATVSSYATSAGLLATLLAILAIKSWPSLASTSALSTAGGMLLVAAVASWWRPGGVVAGLAALRARRREPWHRMSGAHASIRPTCPSGPTLPASIDEAALRSELVALFLRIQEAWQADEVAALRGYTTPEMFDELLLEREQRAGGVPRHLTRFSAVEAELLGVEALTEMWVASVTFRGIVREGTDLEVDAPFTEFWLLIRPPSDASPWRLARHQTLY